MKMKRIKSLNISALHDSIPKNTAGAGSDWSACSRAANFEAVTTHDAVEFKHEMITPPGMGTVAAASGKRTDRFHLTR